MNKRIISLIYRHLTSADFYNINKVGGEEPGGGGQSYIDLSKNHISEANMVSIFGQPSGFRAQGPEWKVSIKSFNVFPSSQELVLYQRRATSYCISSQKIHSREGNRVLAWHPNHGFPVRFTGDIVIYIAKAIDGELWAGWFRVNSSINRLLKDTVLERMTLSTPNCGYIDLTGLICKATGQYGSNPFVFNATDESDTFLPEDNQIIQFQEDISPTLVNIVSAPPAIQERIQKYRKRNKKLCDSLKGLYKGVCQITGSTYSFKKKDGSYYSEVHHLIPLGKNGSDSYWNAIVVCPMIHRMLHCADIGPIDLSKMVNNKLQITINGQPYTITWKPEHAQKVKEVLESNQSE